LAFLIIRKINEIFSYGGAFVECSLQHPNEVEIFQLAFRINEVRLHLSSFFCSFAKLD